MSTEPTPFFDRLVAARSHMVHRIRAKDTAGRWAVYFVYVRENREEAFLAAIGNSDKGVNIDLEDYGIVLGSCYGEEPSGELRAMLKARYGFDI